MIQLIQKSSRLATFVLLILLLASAGCKSKKKAMEAQAAADKAKMEQEAAARKQKEMDEDKRLRAAAEKSRLEAEAMLRDREPKAKLQEYFSAIGNAGSFNSANGSIQEALTLFSSEQVPVLIVISEEGGQKDYDRPTTIKEYLNYLKDQKKRPDKIGEIKYDNAGKITELELIKEK